MPEPQTSTPEVSLADMSLADYRAQREGTPAAAPAKAQPEEKTPSAGEPAGEPVAGEGAAEPESPEQTDEQGTQPQDGKPAKKGGFQRKIERLEREKRELEAQLAAKVAGAAPGSQQSAVSNQPKAESSELKAESFPKPKPKLEDFDSIESFTDALTDWKADERDFKREQTALQAKQQQEANTILDRWNQRKADAQKAHADYDEVLEDVSDIGLSPAHQRIFLESEHGPELAYQLAQDRDALEKFAQMSPLAAARYLGKLEATLSEDTPAEPATKVSSAPRPMRPLGGARATVQPDISKMSLADYRRARESGKLR